MTHPVYYLFKKNIVFFFKPGSFKRVTTKFLLTRLTIEEQLKNFPAHTNQTNIITRWVASTRGSKTNKYNHTFMLKQYSYAG